MKIAIHHREGSFSDRWLKYCEAKDIPYKRVDCYDNDIIMQICDCDALMWHPHHANYQDVLASKSILHAIEQAGILVFPNLATGWHFDDKVAQKYLFEALDLPLVNSYVFYDRKKALKWADKVEYPKVFKLKGGAGSANVSLVKNKKQAISKIEKAFGQGFSQHNKLGYLKDNLQKFKKNQVGTSKVIKSLIRLFVPPKYSRLKGREKGYAYFQDFIPNNDSDIRIIVIAGKAFGIKRLVRKGDFRASGSGDFVYLNEDNIQAHKKCLTLAFSISEKLGAQCLAYDFIYDRNKEPLIVEVSYGFAMNAYDLCKGYWDKELQWYETNFIPQHWIVDDVVWAITEKNIKA